MFMVKILTKHAALIGYTEQSKKIDSMEMRIKLIRDACHTEKHHRRTQKEKEDATSLRKCPSLDEIVLAIRRSYRDFYNIHEESIAKGSITPSQKSMIICLFMGVLHFNGEPGRCGEWFMKKMNEAKDELQTRSLEYMTFLEHKGGKDWGEIVKHIQPGTRKMFLLAFEIPGFGNQQYLFQPPRGTQSQNTARRYLSNWCRVYFGYDFGLGSNMNRKRYGA